MYEAQSCGSTESFVDVALLFVCCVIDFRVAVLGVKQH
jgi:hypothetical protein